MYAYDRRRVQREMKDNMQRAAGKEQTFKFRTPALQALWNEELTGQISDGMWENTPNTGWIYWGNVQTEVADGITHLTKRLPHDVKANFNFHALIEHVGDRMLEEIQKYEPNATEKDLRAYLKEIKDAMKAAK